MDDKAIRRGPRERTTVDVNGSAEVMMYWKTELRSTEKELCAAVRQVGSNAEAVRAYRVKSARQTQRAARGRILLADDNEVIHALFKDVAEARGMEVISATTGAGTLSSAIETQPDLIVLDMQFPDADGRDVLSKLKAESRTAHIPVVVWSGRQGHDSDRRISLDLGAEDYVEKNRAELLVSKLERVLLRLAEAKARLASC